VSHIGDRAACASQGLVRGPEQTASLLAAHVDLEHGKASQHPPTATCSAKDSADTPDVAGCGPT
jgi:hypothetical protein